MTNVQSQIGHWGLVIHWGFGLRTSGFFLLSVLSVISVLNCFAAEPAHESDRATDKPVVVTDPAAVTQNIQFAGGSLYRATVMAQPENKGSRYSSSSFFSVPAPTPKTIKKHDLITVIIREESSNNAQGTSDLKRQSDIEATLTNWFKLKPSNWQIMGPTNLPSNLPGVGFNSTNNFKGDSTVDRQDSMSARITSEVIDVKPNGNLVLSATKHVKFDEEDQVFTLTGTCRAEDVTPDNSVLSTQLMDLDVVKTTKGMVRDTTKRGFVSKMLNEINPF